MNWKTLYLEAYGHVWALFGFLKVSVPIIISLIALWVALKDRRPRLDLKARKGDWYKLKTTLDRRETVFSGIVEVYNVSARANAIQGYDFWRKDPKGKWEPMDSERYRASTGDTDDLEISNHTPIVVPPYSGVEIRVLAFAKIKQPYEMDVEVEFQDIFGRRYNVEVKAIS
ncbi:MAG TPA: hypothetical protein VII95_05265 [Terriglobales bacterium]|jgi:hypothetical protein